MDFALLIPDSHIPNENLAAWELMLRFCSFFRIKIVVILGDFLDCYQFMFHKKDPNFGTPVEMWQREIECGRKRLDQLERFGAGRHIYLAGNHENRLPRYLAAFSPALANSISIPHELDLDRNVSWKWIHHDAYQKYKILGTQIYCTHKPPTGGQGLNVAKQAGATIVYVHTHAFSDVVFVNKITDAKTRAVNLGWLGDETKKVFDYVYNRPNWSLNFGLASNLGTLHPIHIEKDSRGLFIVFGDKEYR